MSERVKHIAMPEPIIVAWGEPKGAARLYTPHRSRAGAYKGTFKLAPRGESERNKDIHARHVNEVSEIIPFLETGAWCLRMSTGETGQPANLIQPDKIFFWRSPADGLSTDSLPTDEFNLAAETLEGRVLIAIHLDRERDPSIVAKKKESAPTLSCECCDFNFVQFYGDLGRDFIECHHRIPLSEAVTSRKTRLEELALVCSNCHRMLHRRVPLVSTPALRRIVAIYREGSRDLS